MEMGTTAMPTSHQHSAIPVGQRTKTCYNQRTTPPLTQWLFGLIYMLRQNVISLSYMFDQPINARILCCYCTKIHRLPFFTTSLGKLLTCFPTRGLKISPSSNQFSIVKWRSMDGHATVSFRVPARILSTNLLDWTEVTQCSCLEYES